MAVEKKLVESQDFADLILDFGKQRFHLFSLSLRVLIGDRGKYSFQIIDLAAKHPYSRGTLLCGRFSRVVQSADEKRFVQNQS